MSLTWSQTPEDTFSHDVAYYYYFFNQTFFFLFYINIQLGIYHVYWQDLTRLFSRDQILILQNTELRNMERTLDKVFEFLDMRKYNFSCASVHRGSYMSVHASFPPTSLMNSMNT